MAKPMATEKCLLLKPTREMGNQKVAKYELQSLTGRPIGMPTISATKNV